MENSKKTLSILDDVFKAIVEYVHDGVIAVDHQGKVIVYNPAAEKLLELPLKHVIGSTFEEVFGHCPFGCSVREALRERRAPEGDQVIVWEGVSGQKTVEASAMYASTDELHRTENEYLIILLHEITERTQLQKVAARNKRMVEIGELTTQVAHEIRNPLGGIRGFAELLSRDLATNPSQQRMADHIVEGTDRLNQLVTQVLNYARPIEMRFESVNIVQLIRKLIHTLQVDTALPHTDRINFIVNTPCEEIVAKVDINHLHAALLNLCFNAIQAMPAGGKLSINITPTENQLMLKIADTGSGISEQDLSKIFLPFFTTKKEGNGFGLAEAKKIIDAHEGTIEVASKLGEGTLFTVRIPLRVQRKGERA